MADAIRSCTLSGGDLLIVSAGVGLVQSEDLVPAYDLTVAGKNSLLSATLQSLAATPQSWWQELAVAGVGRGPIAQLIRARPSQISLVALPSTYLEMVSDDLGSLGDADLERLRILSSPVASDTLPERFRRCLLPYDARLESIPGYAGTTVDFPQRALRHFVERLDGHLLSMAPAHAAIERALLGLPVRDKPVRTRLSDKAIASVIKKNWHANGGSSTRLLRFVRREAGIACEQNRFRDIWRNVRDDLLHEGRVQ